MSNELIYELISVHYNGGITPVTQSKDFGQLEASRAIMMREAPVGIVYQIREVQKVTNEWRVVNDEH